LKDTHPFQGANGAKTAESSLALLKTPGFSGVSASESTEHSHGNFGERIL
jgi:hypothetical protein